MSITIGQLSNEEIVNVITRDGLHYLNTTIIPHDAPDGRWVVVSVSNEMAKELSTYAGYMDGDGSGRGSVSHIGHQGTSDAIAALWHYRVPVDRTPWHGEGLGLALQLRGRIPEGSVLTKEQMDQIGYDWRVIHHENLLAGSAEATEPERFSFLLKIRKLGDPVEQIVNPFAAALFMAQHPEEKFRLRAHDRGTNPHAAVMAILNEQYDCSIIDDGELVWAHPRFASADSLSIRVERLEAFAAELVSGAFPHLAQIVPAGHLGDAAKSLTGK